MGLRPIAPGASIPGALARARMKIAVAATTDPGRLYEHNEDHFVLLRKAGLFLVADGVGGEEAGEVASRLACRIIQQSLSESLPTTDKTRHDAALVKAIQAANHGLHEYAATRPGKAGVGTTLVALWFHGDRALFAYVGDSRIYLYRNGVLRQLSRDEKAGRYRLAASLGQPLPAVQRRPLRTRPPRRPDGPARRRARPRGVLRAPHRRCQRRRRPR